MGKPDRGLPGWIVSAVGFDESAASGWIGGVEGESCLVDCDVVVEPAQGGEVVWVMVSTMSPVFDVVDL